MALQLHPNNLEDGELQVLTRKLNLIQVIDNFCHLTDLPVSCSLLCVFSVVNYKKCPRYAEALSVSQLKNELLKKREDAMKKK